MRKTKHLLNKLKEIQRVSDDKRLQVRDIMTPDVLTIDPEETLVAAAEKMLEKKIHALVVVKEDKPVGIITTYDLVLVMTLSDFDRSTKVKKIMVSDLVTIGPEDSLNDAMKRVIDYNIRRIVVEEEGRVVGVLSLIDIIMGYSRVPEEIFLEGVGA